MLALLFAVVGTVVLVEAAPAPAFAATATGTLTPVDRTDRHPVTVRDGRFEARLAFSSAAPDPMTARLVLRNAAREVVARASGTSVLRLVADVPNGGYRLTVATSRSLRSGHLAYRLEIPAPAPRNSALAAASCGTWVLQQVSSVTELSRLRPRIEAALALPGVTGFSVRFPWDEADLRGAATTHPILDLAREIADSQGKALAIRFMAGEHTPDRVFDAGAAYYLNDGHKVPLPWGNATGDHRVFLDAYDAYLGKLAAWSRANRVSLLHLSWYGQDWAELNHGAALRAAPGYSKAAWLTGHRQLIDVGVRHSGPNLTVEAPLSGYGPLASGESAALADHVLARVGANSDRFLIQANGWDESREWGAPNSTVESQFDAIWDKPVRRGLQMIQPDGYDWTRVFDSLDATDALYAEVYLPSFWSVPGPSIRLDHNTTARIAQLESEIEAFAQRRC